MRAAIYTRISRDDFGTGLGVLRQREDCEALCAKRGWSVTEVYVENDTSAYSPHRRPVYDRLILDLLGGGIDVVVAWAPERLHRSVRQLEDFIDLIESSKIDVETVKAGIWDLSTSHGRLVARLLGAISRHESERMGERISRAHEQAKKRGLWRGSLPYGMRLSNTPGIPEVDPTTAPVVAAMFAQVFSGDSCNKVASDLNRNGVPTAHGESVWTHSSVRRLLSSPAIAGMVSYDGDFIPAAFTGFLDPERWRAFVLKYPPGARRGRARTPSRRVVPGMTLLGGLLRCADHDYPCMGGSAGQRPIYAAHLPGLCNVTIARVPANNIVTQAVLERLGRPEPATLSDALAEDILTVAGCRQGAALMAQAAVTRGKGLRVPDEVWASWSLLEQRDVVRFLFKRLALDHVGKTNGPRVDPRRLHLEWREPTEQ